MTPSADNSICQRVAQVRLETCGTRGKARFAKQLGISPSTYDYYEASRVPPAEILVNIADVGDVDLRWLLTGEAQIGPAVAANHPAIRRAAELLNAHPQAAEPLAAFLDILSQTMAFPDKKTDGRSANEPMASAETSPKAKETNVASPSVSSGTASSNPPSKTADQAESWIPILGRSAAGVPRFWSENDDTTGLTTLADLIARYTAKPPATEGVQPGLAGSAGQSEPRQPVQIITLRTPITWDTDGPTTSVAEFVSAESLKAQYPDAFAVRIDGDSMTPEIHHGELVVLSPSAPARVGQVAVVQLADAIGVTCKLYHPAGRQVHLVPINEQVPTTTVEADQIVWALRVLAHIRPQHTSA